MRVVIILILLASAFAVNAQNTRAWQLFEIGMEASQAGNHSAALKNFEAALKTVERDGASDKFLAKLHYDLGVSNYHLRKIEVAAVEFEKAIRLTRGRYEKASYALGLAKAEIGDWTAAEKSFRDAIALDNRNGEAWFDLAFTCLALKNNVTAQRAFANAIKYGSVDSAISHNNLGVLLAVNGEYASAEIHFNAAIKNSAGGLAAAANNLQRVRSLINSSEKFVASAGFEFVGRNG